MVYNDNEWHVVDFSRDGAEGKLVIDGGALNGKLAHKTPSLDLRIPFYLGGIHPNDNNTVLLNLVSFAPFLSPLPYGFLLQNTTAKFNGCVKNFHMNNKPLESPKNFGVIPCSDNVEVGLSVVMNR